MQAALAALPLLPLSWSPYLVGCPASPLAMQSPIKKAIAVWVVRDCAGTLVRNHPFEMP